MSPDLINAGFEFFAAVFILNHARVMVKCKQAHGVSLLSTAFFASWGAWNIFFYPHVGQMLSFYAGLVVFVANMIWVFTIMHLRGWMPRFKKLENEKVQHHGA